MALSEEVERAHRQALSECVSGLERRGYLELWEWLTEERVGLLGRRRRVAADSREFEFQAASGVEGDVEVWASIRDGRVLQVFVDFYPDGVADHAVGESFLAGPVLEP